MNPKIVNQTLGELYQTASGQWIFSTKLYLKEKLESEGWEWKRELFHEVLTSPTQKKYSLEFFNGDLDNPGVLFEIRASNKKISNKVDLHYSSKWFGKVRLFQILTMLEKGLG